MLGDDGAGNGDVARTGGPGQRLLLKPGGNGDGDRVADSSLDGGGGAGGRPPRRRTRLQRVDLLPHELKYRLAVHPEVDAGEAVVAAPTDSAMDQRQLGK